VRVVAAAPSGGGVTLPTTMTRLALADAASQADPGTRLAAALSDGGAGTGIEFQVTGGWSSSDPLDWPHIIWVPKDAGGTAITSTTALWAIMCEIAERTAAGLSSDTAIAFGVMNESADGAGVDAAYLGIRYTGASRNGLRGVISAGTSTLTHGTANNSIRYVVTPLFRVGEGTAGAVPGPGFALDTNRAVIAAAGLANATNVTISTWGDARPYLFLAVGRTASTAGTETVRVDAYYTPPLVIAAAS
jgi:hypothetical protein